MEGTLCQSLLARFIELATVVMAENTTDFKPLEYFHICNLERENPARISLVQIEAYALLAPTQEEEI